MSPLTLSSVIVTLGFASGLNVYATTLLLGVMARLHWVQLPGTLDAVGNPWIMGACAVLYAVEFFADKLPAFDIVWNILQTFVRVPVAALLAYSAGSQLSPGMHMALTAAGAAIAALAHSAKTVPRLAVLPSPEPVSNIALSTAEDGVALGLTWFAVHAPLAAGSVVVALCAASVAGVWWGARLARKGLARVFPSRAAA